MMMDHDKQPILNGANYGPSVPPTRAATHQTRHHSQHRGGGCCCCLFGVLWKLVAVLVTLAVLALLVFSLIVQRRSFRLYVTDASLTQFDYNNLNHTLNYQLAFNITSRNPNRKLGLYYDRIDVDLYYRHERVTSQYLGTWPVTGALQPTKTSNSVRVVFKGPQFVVLGADEQAANNNDRNAGVYPIDLKLRFQMRYRLGDLISGTIKPKAHCDLKIPLSDSNGKFAVVFESTRCHVRM